MSLNIGKHSVKEVNEVRCTIVEKGCTKQRIDFLTSLLNFNEFEVQVEEEKRKTGESKIIILDPFNQEYILETRNFFILREKYNYILNM